ncbi:hypothetical protein [Deinococcus soli (ex Cha et al. 2016)]|uniref:Uncharacterized protein n=2 Tax=Deinococcus soli (ex Cha et al. 2016) TaxID=1309411 RepID=A0ACC6KH08_9DEIO|nr:hypothetical protein [Deinococcus soli (ex Cha et al. 2016)]MDR6218867.1 hypothetical protein [Deinococcus soli (ex Cha et al. 2016)]MDR6328664.1 hypothetical protein [Deinococcus soli (ex Cha et al. 2016)]MDR6751849.1 hypothetical protein [Deinococcus soli (ex Cha et al. 2016)]
MRVLVTHDILEQLFDPSRRPPELEAARQATLERGRDLRQRSLDRQAERAASRPGS